MIDKMKYENQRHKNIVLRLQKQHQTNKALTQMDCSNQAKSTKTLYTKINNNKKQT